MLTAFLKNALMFVKKTTVKLITSCLPVYLNALVHNAVYNACLLNAVCSYNLCLFLFFARDFCIVIIYANDFCFRPLSLGY